MQCGVTKLGMFHAYETKIRPDQIFGITLVPDSVEIKCASPER